jgi:hypothetical protein
MPIGHVTGVGTLKNGGPLSGVSQRISRIYSIIESRARLCEVLGLPRYRSIEPQPPLVDRLVQERK